MSTNMVLEALVGFGFLGGDGEYGIEHGNGVGDDALPFLLVLGSN